MSYIVVEGLDYAGKSTLVKQLNSIYKCRMVCEPFRETLPSKDVCEKIKNSSLEPVYETQLLIASRIELFEKLNNFIKNNSPTYLLSDRNFLTNMVYQSRSIKGMERIMRLNIDVLKLYGYNAIPHLIIYIEVPYEEALKRFNSREYKNNLDEKIMIKSVYEEMQEKYKTALEMLSSESDQLSIIKITNLTKFENVIYLIDEHMKRIDSIPVKKY